MKLSGDDSLAEGCALVRESINILNQTSWYLIKWCSKSSTVDEFLKRVWLWIPHIILYDGAENALTDREWLFHFDNAMFGTLGIFPDVPIGSWTYFSVAFWIRGIPFKWKQFVANGCERFWIWPVKFNGSTVVKSSILLILSPENCELRNWCFHNFGWRDMSSRFILEQNPLIQLKFSMVLLFIYISQDNTQQEHFLSLGCDPVTDHVNSAVLHASCCGNLCKAIQVVVWLRRFVRIARGSASLGTRVSYLLLSWRKQRWPW